MSHKTMGKRHNNREQTRKLVMLALFTAVAYLSIYIIHFRVQFLTFEFKNVFITIAAMLFGPIAGGVISLVAAFLEFALFSTTGLYGFIMNFVSSASFSMLAALIYRGRRTQFSSYMSLAAATLGSTAMMLIANLLVTPLFMGSTVAEVVVLIPKLIFPFNLIKCLANAALILLFYKPITLVLRRAKMIPGEVNDGDYFNSRTVVSIVVAAVLIAVSLVVLFLILGGSISFGA
ncbi:MAG: ECF transporter S component [Clostridia bacterium]|nr:ECF transporter S component [Clostridia bacterium]